MKSVGLSRSIVRSLGRADRHASNGQAGGQWKAGQGMSDLLVNRFGELRNCARPALLSLAFLALFCTSAAAQKGFERPPTPVEAQRVRVETIADTIHSIGSVAADKSIVVRPEIAGVVSAIHFTDGTPVAKGDLLFSLDDTIYRAEVQSAQARLNLNQRNYNRAIELFKGGAGLRVEKDVET